MRRLALALALTGCAAAGAQPRDREDPFVAIADADPMELARAVDRAGDGAVLARLAPDRPREVRLAAVHAAPWMHEPELALEPLGELARGRDPSLAPAAALSALRIAEGLTLDALARRELELSTLAPARASFSALAEDASARPDLRVAGRAIAARLDELRGATRSAESR